MQSLRGNRRNIFYLHMLLYTYLLAMGTLSSFPRDIVAVNGDNKLAIVPIPKKTQ